MNLIRLINDFQLGKVRMHIPVKPRNCDHLQCFDANLYLMMNEKKPTWKCPVCDQSAKYSDLIIDGYVIKCQISFSRCLFRYFEEVLGAMQSSITEIELMKDGGWKPVESEATLLSDDEQEEEATTTSSSSMSNGKESWRSSATTTTKMSTSMTTSKAPIVRG